MSRADTRLLSIGVSTAATGSLFAGMLLAAFEDRVSDSGCYGPSVFRSNSPAIGFYRKHGFELVGATETVDDFSKTMAGGQSAGRQPREE